jgi:hypothetical protein
MSREISKDLFIGMNQIQCTVSENDNILRGECPQLAMLNFSGKPYTWRESFQSDVHESLESTELIIRDFSIPPVSVKQLLAVCLRKRLFLLIRVDCDLVWLIIDCAIVATLDIQQEMSRRRAKEVTIVLRELKNREKDIIQEVDLTCSRKFTRTRGS